MVMYLFLMTWMKTADKVLTKICFLSSASTMITPTDSAVSHDSQLKVSPPTLCHIQPGGTPILESHTDLSTTQSEP